MTMTLGEYISARMQLVAMLARGHTTDRSRRELRLSRHTVGEEISTLLWRFNCRNRAELVAYSTSTACCRSTLASALPLDHEAAARPTVR